MNEYDLLELLSIPAAFIAWIVALPFIGISFYLCLELVCGLRSLPRRSFDEQANLDIAVLLPAHNEANGIVATVQALRAALPQARLLVVADNCTDDTARLARDAGAEVAERHDSSRRGKGFALDFGREHLRVNPPAVVIVLDADCRLKDGSGQLLAAAALHLDKPVQATNLLVSSSGAHALEGISNFAMLVKNLVRARGLMRIGGGIPLFGTGMAFPWRLFSRLDLASAALAEDLELGLNLAKQGVRVELLDQAMVTSPAASLADNREQRTRWEHGFLSQAKTSALPLLILGLRHRSRHLFGLGAHMSVPPVALHLLFGGVIMVATGLLGLISQSAIPFAATLACMCSLLLLLFLTWLKEGRQVLRFTDLARAPIYVVWKIPIYLGFLINRQTGWKRTRRPDEH